MFRAFRIQSHCYYYYYFKDLVGVEDVQCVYSQLFFFYNISFLISLK